MEYRKTALESLTFGANLRSKSWKHLRKSDQGCPWGGQHRSKGVPYPPEVPNNRSQTKRATAGQVQANGSKMGANIWHFGVLWMIFVCVCVCVFFWHHLLYDFSMDDSIVLGSNLAFFWRLVWNKSNNIFNLEDLCKCTPRPHGNWKLRSPQISKN